MSSASVPGGPKSALRRRAQQERLANQASVRPLSTREAGAGGSSATTLELFTDEAQGISLDPLLVILASIGFIVAAFVTHFIGKLGKK